MNNKKPQDSYFPKDYELKNKLKDLQQNQIPRPKLKEEKSDEKGLNLLKSLNRKVSIFLDSKSIDLTDEEKKKKVGIIVFTLILLILIISAYYFLIYEPNQEKLNSAKTAKLNELDSLYIGALANSNDAFMLKKEIEDANNIYEVESINILGPATKSWKSYQTKSIKSNTDPFNRTMAIYNTNENKKL